MAQIPDLGGAVPQKVDQAIRSMNLQLGALQAAVDKLMASAPATLTQVQALVSPARIAGLLQANGPAPLNVTNLQGRLAQPQQTYVPIVTSLPITSDPLAKDGQLVSYQSKLWRFNASPMPGTWVVQEALGSAIEDTHANRSTYPATTYPAAFYWETDTGLLYLSDGTNWIYQAGMYPRTQGQLAAYAATLGASDEGTRVWVQSVFNHILRWDGSGWTRAPEDFEHSDSFHTFASAPTETGWHLCDGSVVAYLLYDGTTGSRTLPNTIPGSGGVHAYVRFEAAYSATVTLASTPSLVMDSYTPAGSLVMNLYTPTGSLIMNAMGTHTHDAPLGTDGAGNDFRLNVNGQGGSYTAQSKWAAAADSTNSIQANRVSADSAGTPTGTFAGASTTPTGSFSGTPATLTGTVSLATDPINFFKALLYYRS